MARGITTCKGCGKSIPTQEANTYSGKKYCLDCYNIKIQERQEYEQLLSIVCEYFDIEILTGLMLKQIKDYKEQFNYTYGGMTYTLYYCKEIKSLNFDIKYGLAIIKYEYENAENYFLQQRKIQESISNASHEEKIREVKVNLRKQNNKTFLVDIDDLMKDGDD